MTDSKSKAEIRQRDLERAAESTIAGETRAGAPELASGGSMPEPSRAELAQAMLVQLRDIALAEVAHNAVGFAAREWSALGKVLLRLAPPPPPPPANATHVEASRPTRAAPPPDHNPEDVHAMLECLRDVSRAESTRNPLGYAAKSWRQLLDVLDKLAPVADVGIVAPPPPQKGRDR